MILYIVKFLIANINNPKLPAFDWKNCIVVPFLTLLAGFWFLFSLDGYICGSNSFLS